MKQIVKTQSQAIAQIQDLPEWFADWMAGLSANSRRAYKPALQQFNAWRLENALNFAEVNADHAAEYVLYLHQAGSKTSSIRARISALRSFYQRLNDGANNPFKSARVHDKLKFIGRSSDTSKRKAKAIGYGAIKGAALNLLNGNRMIEQRNGIMLLVAFLSGRRRSEVVNMKWQDIEHLPDGMSIRIPRSKSNQYGDKEDSCHFFYSDDKRVSVPVLLNAWRKLNKSEYLFPSIHKSGEIQNKPLLGRDLNRVIKQNLGEQYSGHSLRRGFITEAYSRSATIEQISFQTGQNPNVIHQHYTDQIDRRAGNAAKAFN